MRTPSPVFANVAFLRIPGFDGRPVAQQASLKERLEARLREAIAGMPAAERIVLDADDGLAVVLFGEPARALDLAQSLRAAPGEEPLKVGVNHGPIAVTARDAGGVVFGDGITAAAAASGVATAGKTLVTAAFARMMEATRPDRAAELAPAGEFTDARVRLHAFYTPDPQRLVARRNRLAAHALVGILLIVSLGLAGRSVIRYLLPPRPAIVEFDVRPKGEVLIDGLSYGPTPPLLEVEVPPGRHHILVRSGRNPPVDVRVDLEPGERMSVTHSFAGERPAPKPGGFLRDLGRDVGRALGLAK